jgi:hypothetical protein
MIIIKCDWICELCYKPVVGNLPNDWELVWGSAMCPDCMNKVKLSGKSIMDTKCGCFSYMPDSRGKN